MSRIRACLPRKVNSANLARLHEPGGEWQKGKDLKIDDIHDEVAGEFPKVMIEGNMDAGGWSCSKMVGLINYVPPVKELIDRIMGEVERIIRAPGWIRGQQGSYAQGRFTSSERGKS